MAKELWPDGWVIPEGQELKDLAEDYLELIYGETDNLLTYSEN